MKWFGPESWNAPVNDGQRCDIPAGRDCMECGELIDYDDTGFLLPYFRSDGLLGDLVCHRECMLLHTVGHVYGLCVCTGYEGMTPRDAARELQNRVGREP